MPCHGLLLIGLCILAASAPGADLVIRAFSSDGRIAFGTVTNAEAYRIEWADAPGGVWRGFPRAADELDGMPGAGSGPISVAVPALYRVVGLMAPSNMAFVPAGSFVMGNPTNVFTAFLEGEWDELPRHPVTLRAFFMDRAEVSGRLWQDVWDWGQTNGYPDIGTGSWIDPTNPVYGINWYDAAKWCNARSEREGLTPAYYVNTSRTAVYREGVFDLEAIHVDWSASGYRLPTEAEWERAARGGAEDTRFPWTDFTNRISHAWANYVGDSPGRPYDLSDGYHPDYSRGGGIFFKPYTAPVASMPANGFGLYHMAGNLAEWCWDWHHSNYYSNSPADNPRGPAYTGQRVVRGGHWDQTADQARCSSRRAENPHLSSSDQIGLRCVIGL